MNAWAILATVLAVFSGCMCVVTVMRRSANWKSTALLMFGLAIEFAGQASFEIAHSLMWDRIREGTAGVVLVLFIWAVLLRSQKASSVS